jgi:hypothetical protein
MRGPACGYALPMRRHHRFARATFAALAVIAVPFAGACADEDGDGATTDEEIQDVKDESKDAEQELEEEVEGQNEGSNENDGG